MTADERPVSAPPVRVWECVPCGRTYVALGETCALCGEATKELTGHGGGLLTSWTTIYATTAGEDPYTIGWVELDGTGLGVLGRFEGDPSAIRHGLTVTVRQMPADDGWPRLWVAPAED